MKPSQLIATIICLSLVLIAAGCTDSSSNSSDSNLQNNTPTAEESLHNSNQNYGTPSGQNLTVHFLDVGQGDSILIEYKNKSMLIDAGESDQGKVVSNYLKDQGISTLDYVVATHPHSDHIGGMIDVLNNFKIKHFIDSGYPHTSKTYENMLTTIDQEEYPI